MRRKSLEIILTTIQGASLGILLSCMSLNGRAIAQEVSIPTDASSFSPTGNSQELGKTNPVNTNNFDQQQQGGIQQQFNNSGYSPLQQQTCRTNSCFNIGFRHTPQGTELLGTLQFGFGGSSDETNANANQYRAETERLQAKQAYRLNLIKEVRTLDEKRFLELVLKELKN
ncbi:hypothetical protein V2H45_06445 [Tumidithrix elongata RA019]|uniref:Uncharacterized protein n=1 Tax=Tumidithrix elongata BACA0141 TaxID=2716417 RepID=A0AAW9PR63_9CYAN|nr:hypothetical protein [Tumidithrix elongata RA019]